MRREKVLLILWVRNPRRQRVVPAGSSRSRWGGNKLARAFDSVKASRGQHYPDMQLYERLGLVNLVRCVGRLSVGERVSLAGEPDAGDPPVRICAT